MPTELEPPPPTRKRSGTMHRAWRVVWWFWLFCAVPTAWAEQVADEPMPFGQVVNLVAVREVTSAPPAALLATLRRWGLEVMRVPSPAPSAPANPLLERLPVASADLLRRAEFQDGYEGRLVCRDEHLPQRLDLILIRDNAPTYTLLHEFVHAVVKPVCPAGSEDPVIEVRFNTAWRRLTFFQRRLYDNPYHLLDPRWRRDILSAQTDVAADLYDRIRFGQSQEAIAEKLLQRHITQGSPYFDAARREQGRAYAEAMIDNAIDLFNTLEASRRFVGETVQHLLQALQQGDVEPAPTDRLTEADVQEVAAACEAVARQMTPTRQALEELKAFQRR